MFLKNTTSYIVFILSYLVCAGVTLYMSPTLIKKKGYTEKDTLSYKKKMMLNIVSLILLFVTMGVMGYYETNLYQYFILSAIGALSMIILITDARIHIIPNKCLFPMVILITIYHIVNKDYVGLGNGLVAMFFTCYGILLLTSILHFKGYFGAGDIKFLSVGAYLFGLGPNMIGFVAGWVISLFLIEVPLLLLKKISMKSMVAYGPFLSVGMMTGIIFLTLTKNFLL